MNNYTKTIIRLRLVSQGNTNIQILLIIVIYSISMITQVIIEILALSLTENGVIFRYNNIQATISAF